MKVAPMACWRHRPIRKPEHLALPLLCPSPEESAGPAPSSGRHALTSTLLAMREAVRVIAGVTPRQTVEKASARRSTGMFRSGSESMARLPASSNIRLIPMIAYQGTAFIRWSCAIYRRRSPSIDTCFEAPAECWCQSEEGNQSRSWAKAMRRLHQFPVCCSPSWRPVQGEATAIELMPLNPQMVRGENIVHRNIPAQDRRNLLMNILITYVYNGQLTARRNARSKENGQHNLFFKLTPDAAGIDAGLRFATI